MSDYNAKNYTEQGGDVTHIGGKLIFEDGSSVEGLPSSFTPAENQADSEATTVAALKEDIRTWAASSVILSAALFLFVPDGISTNDIED